METLETPKGSLRWVPLLPRTFSAAWFCQRRWGQSAPPYRPSGSRNSHSEKAACHTLYPDSLPRSAACRCDCFQNLERISAASLGLGCTGLFHAFQSLHLGFGRLGQFLSFSPVEVMLACNAVAPLKLPHLLLDGGLQLVNPLLFSFIAGQLALEALSLASR